MGIKESLEDSLEGTKLTGTLRGTNTDLLLSRKLHPKVLDRLVEYRNKNAQGFTSIVDYLARQYYGEGKSLQIIEGETKVFRLTLKKIFDIYGFPLMTQAQATKKMLDVRNQDSNFRKKILEAKKGYVEKKIEYRKDLNRITYSSQEANIERAIRYSRRKYEMMRYVGDTRVFNHSTHHPIYFRTTDPRGGKKAYVLIAKPDRRSYERKKELERQGMRVRFMTERFYKTLERLVGKRKIWNWEKN